MKEFDELRQALDRAIDLMTCKHVGWASPGACPECMNTGILATCEEDEDLYKAMIALQTEMER